VAAPAPGLGIASFNLTMSDLGVTPGVTITNYAVTGPALDDLPDLDDETDFGTDGGTSPGVSYKRQASEGDAFTAMVEDPLAGKKAPEPAAYAEVFLTACLALYAWKRRPRRLPQ
jgi:hypothetical protein